MNRAPAPAHGPAVAPVADPDRTSDRQRPLRVALVITASVLVVEVAGGVLSRSLALLADAGHMLTDVAALGLSLFAFWLSGRPSPSGRTFGWRRFEIFAAALNGIALWIIAAVIGYQAFLRLRAPQPVKGGLMLAVAVFGLAANIASGAVLYRSRARSLNVRGAFLHVAADALGSLGVLAAALLIALTGSPVWDPIVSAAVCVLILWSSAELIRDSFRVFMESAPAGIDVAAVAASLAAVPGVVEVHDLHVWAITPEFISLSAHLKVRTGAEAHAILRRSQEEISSRFGILHSTFQIEAEGDASCATNSCDVKPSAPDSTSS
ncbi:MAG TPA: cation diffusion facilitator family transporter [Candidatus Aminicenantes bacterium]|nr:cation diffusion facilitator family transporter [Candidatus Aminicenantes bacterium]HRY64019.1 cation diffusion facilitator family transporter [Candidatus Aminicenantes bacterium]HRZ70932.1 cation diffusion facilitator family transporter [Candidatus Aminicenantes bacterium]